MENIGSITFHWSYLKLSIRIKKVGTERITREDEGTVKDKSTRIKSAEERISWKRKVEAAETVGVKEIRIL